jgi:DNA-binding transcriptional LysR family regulator
MSRGGIQEAASAFGLKILPVKELTWIRQVGIIYRRETYLPPALVRFIDIIKAAAKEMAAR